MTPYIAYGCAKIDFLLFFVASLSLTWTTNSESPPSWQTIFPDTQIVVPLFGKEGPEWRMFYSDTPNHDPTQGNFSAQVPGDLVSDHMHNRMILDPFVDMNLWEQEDIWLGPQPEAPAFTSTDKPKPCQKKQIRIWKYSTEFDLTDHADNNYDWRLVIESIQMGATIRWNGVFVANVTDQFLRYSLPITQEHLSVSGGLRHSLSVTFDPSINTDGRFMACAGGWDWAPYTLACDDQGRRIFSRGIVQPIYLIALDQVAITHVVPKVYYQGSVPRKQMMEPEADFLVQLDVHLELAKSGPPSTSVYQIAAISNFAKGLQLLPARESKVSFNITAPKESIKLWWPNGMGAQPMYELQVAITKMAPSEGDAVVSMQRQLKESDHIQWITKGIGFRTSAIVTINETTLGADQNDNLREEGTGMHGMYIRINGALVMARGANIIPNDQLEGRFPKNHNDTEPSANDKAYEIIVQSAAAANMNIIRVWGGGKVLPQIFYEACDTYGIMVYQDQMFVDEDNHGPHHTETIRLEIQHTVRSLASHPSIVVWNGCNECQVVMGTPSEIYATFVLQTVATEDDTRSIWPSSPSKYGWETGVNRYDSTPNGKPLATRNPEDHKNDPALETHGPYMRAWSYDYPGVNGVNQHFPYPTRPNKLYSGEVGPQYQNSFASEFGASVWSSFESMSGTLDPKHWGLHGGGAPDKCYVVEGNYKVCEGSNVMAQRNYPCDTHIEAYFGNSTSLEDVGITAFQAQLYQCLMAQALWMKGDIENRRSHNTFGLLIWQLNENWPTGGWGLIEYSGDSLQPLMFPGQIFGGRWKPLMHMLQSALFRDVFAACGMNNWCYVRNDGTRPVDVIVTLEAWNIASSQNGSAPATHYFQASLEGGVSKTVRFRAPQDWGPDRYDAIIMRVSNSESGSILMDDTVFLWNTMPKLIANLRLTVDVVVQSINPGPDQSTAVVTLSSSGLALYVVLTTMAPGRFEENAFVLRPNQQKMVSFVTLLRDCAVDMSMLRKSLRVEHLSLYAFQ